MMDAPTQNSSQISSAPGSQSPISQLLVTLGLTREDLTRHSAQMREFLTAESSNASRPFMQAATSTRSSQSVNIQQQASSSQSTETMSISSRRSSPTAFSSHTATTPTPPPFQISTSRTTKAKSMTRKDSASTSTQGPATEKTHRRRERRQPPQQATSPIRPKPSLDEIMLLRSRNAKQSEEPEDESDSSEDGSFFELYRARQKATHASSQHVRQTIYSHASSSVEPPSASKYYRQESPAVSLRKGNYYRNHADPSKTPDTPTKSSLQTPVPTQIATPTKPKLILQPPVTLQRLNSTSSPTPSSPFASSPNITLNIASSPGPLVSSPAKQSDPELPFVLPPGPYSEDKPELSYAALIGRAILASPAHRLRLKDIYDYISIVFPYFKRDGHSHGQKWMNAIRQNLTNTPQFHKSATVDPVTKSSYWYIKDSDLPCFANGGYNRHALNPYGAPPPSSRDKRKRKDDGDNNIGAKKARVIPQMHPPNPYHFPYGYPQLPMHFPIPGQPFYIDQSRIRADMVFPPIPTTHPSAQMLNPVHPSGNDHVIFPPLPASSQTRIAREAHLKAQAQLESGANMKMEEEEEEEVEADSQSDAKQSTPPLPPSDASTSSLPELVSNDSSSSPPNDPPPQDELAQPIALTGEPLVTSDTAGPGSLHGFDGTLVVGKEIEKVTVSEKGKGRAIEPVTEDVQKYPSLPPMPTTPTSKRGHSHGHAQSRSLSTTRILLGLPLPPEGHELDRPTTPPSKANMLLSAVSLAKTPTSRRGPTTPRRGSVRFDIFDGDNDKDIWNEVTLPQTPSRNKTTNNPVTPKRIFSPFSGFSPFRTPSSRMFLDPYDPSALLDEELSALASSSRQQGPQESPVGFFGHGKGLLYESPGVPSPTRWQPW